VTNNNTRTSRAAPAVAKATKAGAAKHAKAAPAKNTKTTGKTTGKTASTKTAATKAGPAKVTKTAATKHAEASTATVARPGTRGGSKPPAVVADTAAETVVEAAVETAVAPEAAPAAGNEAVRVERSGGEWRDLNKEMFWERARIRAEIDTLELEDDRIKRRILNRRKREFEDLTLKIIESNYGLLRKYVRLFTGSATKEDAKDFEAAGRLGLMRAIDSYDPDKGSFAQWAFKPIQREVLRAVHSADHSNMNPGDFERRPDILRALKKLQGENEENRPSDAEVAVEAKVTIEQVKRVLNAPRMDSLYTPVGDGDAVLGELIEDRGAAVDDMVVNAIGVEALENYGLGSLDPREYFVLSRRLGLDCEPEQRLSAIGEMLKLSREAVRQIESKAIAKLSHPVLLRQLVREGKP
jgi:RNA polymerase sigma factor (sigma-70 family)